MGKRRQQQIIRGVSLVQRQVEAIVPVGLAGRWRELPDVLYGPVDDRRGPTHVAQRVRHAEMDQSQIRQPRRGLLDHQGAADRIVVLTVVLVHRIRRVRHQDQIERANHARRQLHVHVLLVARRTCRRREAVQLVVGSRIEHLIQGEVHRVEPCLVRNRPGASILHAPAHGDHRPFTSAIRDRRAEDLQIGRRREVDRDHQIARVVVLVIVLEHLVGDIRGDDEIPLSLLAVGQMHLQGGIVQLVHIQRAVPRHLGEQRIRTGFECTVRRQVDGIAPGGGMGWSRAHVVHNVCHAHVLPGPGLGRRHDAHHLEVGRRRELDVHGNRAHVVVLVAVLVHRIVRVGEGDDVVIPVQSLGQDGTLIDAVWLTRSELSVVRLIHDQRISIVQDLVNGDVQTIVPQARLRRPGPSVADGPGHREGLAGERSGGWRDALHLQVGWRQDDGHRTTGAGVVVLPGTLKDGIVPIRDHEHVEVALHPAGDGHLTIHGVAVVGTQVSGDGDGVQRGIRSDVELLVLGEVDGVDPGGELRDPGRFVGHLPVDRPGVSAVDGVRNGDLRYVQIRRRRESDIDAVGSGNPGHPVEALHVGLDEHAIPAGDVDRQAHRSLQSVALAR